MGDDSLNEDNDKDVYVLWLLLLFVLFSFGVLGRTIEGLVPSSSFEVLVRSCFCLFKSVADVEFDRQ